MKLNKDTR